MGTADDRKSGDGCGGDGDDVQWLEGRKMISQSIFKHASPILLYEKCKW